MFINFIFQKKNENFVDREYWKASQMPGSLAWEYITALLMAEELLGTGLPDTCLVYTELKTDCLLHAPVDLDSALIIARLVFEVL